MQVVSGPLGRERIHFEAPPSRKIDHEIALFLSWWNAGTGRMEGLIRAAIAHFWFVTIHPFEDRQWSHCPGSYRHGPGPG
ncbi:MAG: Fic family protein [Desulfobacterales bacterium]|nr:Fic family protein [Desulfobacterales bacterium]